MRRFLCSGGELLWGSVVRTLFIEAGHELTPESVRTTVEFEGLARLQEKRIVYEIVGPDAPRQKPNGNFALAAALPTAMSLGRPLHFRGEVDADFLATMEEYMAAWCRWRPDLFQPVGVSADVETASRPSHATHAIMAFSGGSTQPSPFTPTSMACSGDGG
jgi:hypothetical protein